MPASSLRDLIERVESATGEARIGVPRDVDLGLTQLVRSPRVFVASIAGGGLREHITLSLRELAAMRDPVADAHAGWLLAVTLRVAGIAPQHDHLLPASTEAKLTPEGRAWLVQQAMDCVQTAARSSARCAS
ncbi:MAG: hypothetical protein AAFO89_08460, partial [Planctomycetota bacterium]